MQPVHCALNRSFTLDVNGTHQALRLCATRGGLPPVLVVQAGPGFPLLHEVSRFQRLMALERHFLVAYWDQRGTGRAPSGDAFTVTPQTQVDDLSMLLRWLSREAGQPVVVLGISLGATFALQAAARAPEHVRAVVAVSAGLDLPASDVAALAYLRQAATQAGRGGLARQLEKLGEPPNTSPAQFQLRARLLADLGGMESGRGFMQMLRCTLTSLLGCYGVAGTVAALRNLNAVQEQLLPQLASLDLLRHWQAPSVPVHYVFGEDDPLIPAALVARLSDRLGEHDSVLRLPCTGHLAHFDQPAMVRGLVMQAHAGP